MPDSLSAYLFTSRAGNVYTILDGASVPDLLDKLYDLEPEWACLYRGELEPDLAEVAPYVVRLQPEHRFTAWLLANVWGRHWGIFLTAADDLDVVRRHFRRFLIVHDTEGKPLYFRFYDPRVLRVYLPTCNAEEIGLFFGPVMAYIAEDEPPENALQFTVHGGELRKEERAVAI